MLHVRNEKKRVGGKRRDELDGAATSVVASPDTRTHRSRCVSGRRLLLAAAAQPVQRPAPSGDPAYYGLLRAHFTQPDSTMEDTVSSSVSASGLRAAATQRDREITLPSQTVARTRLASL